MQPKVQPPVTPSEQSVDFITITPSDTVKIKDQGDVTNPDKYEYVFLECTTASGPVRVMSKNGKIGVIYLIQGVPKPLAVKQVFNTSPTPPGTLIGYV